MQELDFDAVIYFEGETDDGDISDNIGGQSIETLIQRILEETF